MVQGYLDPEHFCDREEETRQLISHIENGRNVTLMAPRRYGKSGLIRHAMRTHADEYAFAYVDLLSTTCLDDFVRVTANAVVTAVDTQFEKAASTFAGFFKSVRPIIKTDVQGETSFSFEMSSTAPSTTVEQIFDYLSKKRNREIVVALDEFQQVAKYPETGTEAQLRSRIQFMPPNVHFIFAGSQMHLLSEMFSSPKRPFFHSTAFQSLGVIAKDTYCKFAKRFFAADRRAFDVSAFSEIYDRFDGITWYMQAILNELWSTGEGLTDVAQVDAVVENLVSRQSLSFHDLCVSQSESAQALLRAVARAGCVAAPTSAEFLAESGLNAPSTVAGALRQLLEKELLYKTDSGYVVYDRLFGEYLKQI